MHATVGDRMVVAGNTLGAPVRDGEIIEVRGADGGAPYVVRWSDNGHETLFFPGPTSHVDHLVEDAVPAGRVSEGAKATAASAASAVPHSGQWRIDVYLFEDDRDTTAHAVLHTGAPSKVDSRGKAHRNPADPDVPEIGDEVAVARALRRLADRLLGVASQDLAEREGHPVHLRA